MSDSSDEDDMPLSDLKSKPTAKKKPAAKKTTGTKKKIKKKDSKSSKQKSSKTAAAKKKKTPAKSKATPKRSTGSKASTAKAPTKKFDLIGQIKERPTAPEYASFEALRIFHTTNFKENGKSEMSARWCMERGLLRPEFQKKWHKYFEKKKGK